MVYSWLLLAQEQGGKEGAPGWTQMVPFIVITLLFLYMMIILPSRKEKQQRQQLLSALKKNDEVVTSAGIIGVVVSIKEKEDEVTLKIDDNARIRVLKSSIARIVSATKPETKN